MKIHGSTSKIEDSFQYGTKNKSNQDDGNSFADSFNAAANDENLTVSNVDGKRLSLDGIILPTFANLEILQSQLTAALNEFFQNTNISNNPPIDISVNWETGEIIINGDRPDINNIGQSINSNEEVKEKIRTCCAIASHACGMSKGLNFSKEYLASNNPEEVVAKYSYLFSQNPGDHELSLNYSSNGITFYYDHELWSIPKE